MKSLRTRELSATNKYVTGVDVINSDGETQEGL